MQFYRNKIQGASPPNQQLKLLTSVALKLSIRNVPDDIAIAIDRYFLELEFGGDRHIFPIQLTRAEAEILIQQARDLDFPDRNKGVSA